MRSSDILDPEEEARFESQIELGGNKEVRDMKGLEIPNSFREGACGGQAAG